MSVNANFSDAGAAQANPIARVTCDLKDENERAAFLDTLEMALLQPSQGLIYIASINISQNDREAAEHIAWLRANAHSIGANPKISDLVGALGEWALLRLLGLHQSVKPVSLVSFSPEPKPDFVVEYTGTEALFDIKTTASMSTPSAYINPTLHEKKGSPHIIGICLSDKWENKPIGADIYVLNSKYMISPAIFEKMCAEHGGPLQSVVSLKGYLA